ncbi:uncharacterized protein BDR25DRAFT_22181 [Lindgomyces ingoldianus]|uniref:Uncharacterized protein n=1 Tax=Lindgomyces ingoldianus TaxID=673940 RepID=A0ACB6QXD3_9PLEO|nr:uncharacterized protein BDR25DRAFT_22181 [Lindgomyces ingoldianus]KAF2471673.1 hypothetical protein BDR25DRAFT_22181 [Lindgomyces ingoldianus]
MSLFHTLERTTNTVVSNVGRPILTFLCPSLLSRPFRRMFRPSAADRRPRISLPSTELMDTLFIQALACAGSCEQHARQISTMRKIIPFASKHHKIRRKSTFNDDRREFQSSRSERRPFNRFKKFAERELKALVDYYGIQLDSGPEGDQFVDDGPLIWNIGDEHQPWPVREELHKAYIEKLVELLVDEETPHKEVYSTYKLLPSPGVVYLDIKTIRALLHHLSIVERADQLSMQRFLSILDDMKDAHIHIIRSEWTSAIYFAGRFMGKVSEDEVESSLFIWREMEKRAGLKGGTVTMSVLFDICVKAGKYTLAEAFLKEIQARKLKIHRHFRVSLIYYYGVLQNGNGVRKTYQDLVSAGDIVDTVVMNAVIAALFRAGEPAAAEHVFERMKRLHATKKNPKPPPRRWRDARKFGLDLTYNGRRFHEQKDAEALKNAQDFAPIAPDTRTYGLLIRHYAAIAGNIDRVTELLNEMHLNSIPPDGTIFIVILYGFSSFGGVRYSSWTRDRLESLWQQYLQATQIGAQRTWISSMAVVAALKAFKKCTDSERTLKAWEEVRRVWDPTPEEVEMCLKALRRLVPEQGFFEGNVRR